MRNKIVVTRVLKVLIGVLILVALAVVVFADDYHWECMTYGDCLSGGYCCYKDRCFACVKNGYTRVFYRCYDKPMCEWGSSSNIDQEPPGITVNAPLDGSVFSSKYVDFDIEINEPSTLYYLDSADERRGYMRMCSRCTRYTRSRRFDDGPHTLTFKAIDRSGNEGFAEVSFIIDSKEPKIRRTYPKDGEYVSTDFIVEYDEENLVSITLHWKPGGSETYTDVTKTNCPAGKRQTCVFTVDGLPQGEVYYYFSVADVASNADSDEVMIYVDTMPPQMTVNSPVDEALYPERRVEFEIHVNEEVTLEYIDYFDRKPRFRRLCSRCTEYTRSKSFRDGFHNITIRATDNAGNTNTTNISFIVDSKDPRIKRIEPRRRDYTNGSFTVKYDEENVEKVELYYKLGEGSEYNEPVLGDCDSGKNQECTIIIVEGLEDIKHEELWYYFVIEDIVGHVDVSRENMVYVDTVSPEMSVNSPVNGGTYGRRVDFEISVTEEVEIGYIDNSDPRQRYRRLCSRCDSYTRSKSFSYGPHDLTIFATDEAGNSDVESISFTVA